jgi:hypothetical protein
MDSGSLQTFLRPRTNAAARTRRLAVDVGLALLIGLVAAAAKRYLGFHIGLPGHAGVGWIATLVAGSFLNPRRGMTLIAGASMGLWGVPLGISHSLGYNTAMYATAAAALEGVRMALPLHRFHGATAAGVAVHVVKHSYELTVAWASGVMTGFRVYGFLASLRNHIIFGFLGGALAWASLRSWHWLARRNKHALKPPLSPR